MKILVTGCAGLIGSHLTDKLLEKKYQVIGVDNFITGNKDNIAHNAANPNFTFIKADISEPCETYLPTLNSPISHIFHLASPASPRGYMDNPFLTYKANSFGTHYLAKLACKNKAQLLFASTSEVYGDPLVHPQAESYWGNVNPNGLRSCYDESKRFGEMVCKVFERLDNLDVRIVRIFNTYGPRNDPNDGRVVPNLIVQALKNKPLTIYGNGKQTRSFCYVNDLVAGLVKLMFTPKLNGVVVNLGNPNEFTILQLAEKIKTLTNSQSKIVFAPKPADDPSRRKPDIKKAQKLLGWQATTNLEDGLIPTIAYFKKILKIKS